MLLRGRDSLSAVLNIMNYFKIYLSHYTFMPIFYLLQKFEMHPDMIEEASEEELTLIVQEFCNTYGIKEH